jgi:hypothetical protein
MKYFVTAPQNLASFNVKLKAGDIVELTPETAAAYNVACPGLVEEYDPEKHTPAPVPNPEPAPGFVTTPVSTPAPEVKEEEKVDEPATAPAAPAVEAPTDTEQAPE